MSHLYFDNNSTTVIDPRVIESMTAALSFGYANPASQHQPGQLARRTIEDARNRISQILKARTSGTALDRAIFTSGGTEANNLALLGLAGPKSSRVIISAIEHPSIIGAAARLRALDYDVQYLSVNVDGVIEIDKLPELINNNTSVVSIMLANNETGVLQSIEKVSAICRDAGVLLHTDAVQAVGKIDVDFTKLDVDAMTVSAHKFHGPRGIGLLLTRHDLDLEPMMFGGVQQLGFRPGTEDVALAIGMMKALQLWQDEHDNRHQHMLAMRIRMEKSLTGELENCRIIGADAPRLPHTICASFLGVNRQAMLLAADVAGLAISTGSACASGSSEASPVLLAMGCSTGIVDSAVRISLCHETTADDVDLAVAKISKIVRNLTA